MRPHLALRRARGVSLALLSLLALAGCVIESTADDERPRVIGGDGAGASPDLRLTIRLDGRSCDDAPEVARLHVVLDGPAIVDDRPLCPPEGTELVIPSLPAGRYAYRIEGLSPADEALYAATGSVQMALGPDVQLTVDLAPLSGGGEGGLLGFDWTFGGAGCAEAGIEVVRIEAGAFAGEVACDEAGVQGVAIEGLASGAIAYRLEGLDALGLPRFAAAGSTEVPASGERRIALDLEPLPETLSLVWTFDGQGSCVLAGVERVGVELRAAGTLIYQASLRCGDGAAVIHGLSTGAHVAELAALDAAGRVVYEAVAVPLTVAEGGGREIVDLGAR